MALLTKLKPKKGTAPHIPLRSARFSKPALIVFVLTFAGIGGYILTHSFAASTTQTAANLWIDPTGGSCTRQSTPGSYSDAGACSSMQAAMTAAQTGDKVVVKCGTYAAQTISTGTKSGVVTFYAETYDQAVTAADAYSAGTCVYVGGLSINGVDKVHIYGIQATPTPNNSRTDAHLTYAGGGSLDVCDTGCTTTATTDILIDGFHGRSAFLRATGLIIDHSSFGGWDACYDTSGNHLASGNPGTEDGVRYWDGTGGSPTPTNSVFRNSVIHDIIMGVNDSEENSVCTFGSSLGPHSDCMQNNGGSNVTIENNIFFNCPSSDIQWTNFSGATVGAETVQNNYFGSIGGTGNGTVLGAATSGADCSNIIVRNNFYNNTQGINVGSGCTAGAMQIYGNIMDSGGFSTQGANYHDNVFESNPLGTNARSCTPTFTSTPAPGPNWLVTTTPDFHLASSDTCAKDHGYTTYPATDWEGDSRPQGPAADAGPDEVLTATGPTANLWVDSTGGTCTRSAAPAVYSDAAACASFSAAYNAASAGDTIYVKAGTYGAQTVPARSIGTTVVTISAAPGETAYTGGIEEDSSYVTINGFNAGSNVINAGGTSGRTGVTISNNTLAGAGSAIKASYGNITIIGNDISGTNQCASGGEEDAIQFYGNGTFGAVIPSNIVVKNNFIHDMANAFGGCGAHADGMQAFGCANCTIDGNRFNNTDTSFIIIYAPNGTSSGEVQNITIQNNSFGTVKEPGHGVSIGGEPCSGAANVLIQNNTFYSGTTYDVNCTNSTAAATIRNNIFIGGDQYTDCSAYPYTIDYNIYSSLTGCGTHKKNCTPAFVDSAHTAGNIDLASSDTCAIDYVPATTGTYPSTDIHGTSRPQGISVDAGAYEYTISSGSSGPTIGDLNSDGHVNITDLSIMLSHYGTSGTAVQGDCNADGFINISDLSILLSHYGI